MLKALMLRKKIDDANKELIQLREKIAKHEEKRSELEGDIAEAETDEEKAAVEAAVEEFENAQPEIDEAIKSESELSESVSEMERELEELESKSEETAPADSSEESRDSKIKNIMEVRTMQFRTKQFKNMSAETRSVIENDDEVKSFCERVRIAIKEKRAITGGNLLIPKVVLDILRDNVAERSQLLPYVNNVPVDGESREIVPGTIPEAVWTEMCANLNELALGFNDAEVDGYKVGGYIPVCNALIEDNDVSLVDYIVFALGAAIAIALDKAILYGTGTKMPLGIVTRLAQTSEPSGYPSTARTWVDLHTSNIKTISDSVHGKDFFKAIMAAFKNAKSKYSTGKKFWAMNESTYMDIQSEALDFNANGAIVSGVNAQMPVVGGDIVILPDNVIADGNIVAGHGDVYLLAERAGANIQSSEHVMFLADKTVFKGTARYDGMPVIAEDFVAIGLGSAPATSATFAEDSANP